MGYRLAEFPGRVGKRLDSLLPFLRVIRFCLHRQFYLTEKGYVGWVPSIAEVGMKYASSAGFAYRSYCGKERLTISSSGTATYMGLWQTTLRR